MPPIKKEKKFNTRAVAFSSIVFENFLSLTPRRLIFSDGSSLFEYQNKLTSQYTFFDYYQNHYIGTLIEQSQTPHLIVTACGSFSHLDTIEYSTKIIDFLNRNGLDIYLYETIFIDIGEKRTSLTNADAENTELIDDYAVIKNSITGFETSKESYSQLYCFEFEKIKNFVLRNNLNNVTVHTGDYQILKYFSNLYPQFRFKTLDIFLVSLFSKTDSDFTSYQYINDAQCTLVDITYKFWCGNRRYEGYRHLTVAYLINKSSLCSYQHKIEDSPFSIFDKDKSRQTPIWGSIDNYLWFNLNKWKDSHRDIYNCVQTGFDIIDTQKSISTDCEITQYPALEALPVPVAYYQQCFCSIVTEARYAYPMGQFSEKTINAIKAFSPFILVAPPNTLKYLKSYGIKTFNEYWDESYDLEENHEKRLIKIFQLIDYIDSYSIEDLRQLQKNLQPILQHNYNTVKNIAVHDINKYCNG